MKHKAIDLLRAASRKGYDELDVEKQDIRDDSIAAITLMEK